MTAIEINDNFSNGDTTGEAPQPTPAIFDVCAVTSVDVADTEAANSEAANADQFELPGLESAEADNDKSATNDGNAKTKQANCVVFPAVRPNRALDNYLHTVFKLLHSKACPDAAVGLSVILNLHKTPVVQYPNGLFFGNASNVGRFIPMAKDTADFFIEKLVNKYHVIDPIAVSKVVSNQWTRNQSDLLRAGLGKYYTPAHVTSLIVNHAKPILDTMPDACVLDMTAGMGALLKPFSSYRCIGWDIDTMAVAAMKDMGLTDVHCGNSLTKVSRKKFGIRKNELLFLIGNLPYSDATSQHKRALKKSKTKAAIACDIAFDARDLGTSCLLAAAALEPDAICMLHPLSFLIKETNFNQLKGLSDNYKLETGIVFSSVEFGLTGTPFPIVAALYMPGKMDFKYIQAFEFQIFKNKDGAMVDTDTRLKLDNLQTTRSFIRNSPPTKAMPQTSDIGVYQYNFRDANYVMTSAAMTDKSSASTIPVRFKELGKYAYINCFKRYFGKDFVFGNVAPLARIADFADADFVDSCIYDAIMNNQRLKPMQRSNPASFVVTQGVINGARTKSLTFNGAGINPHAAFVQFWDNDTGADALSGFFVDYFKKLKAASLVVPVPPIVAP